MSSIVQLQFATNNGSLAYIIFNQKDGWTQTKDCERLGVLCEVGAHPREALGGKFFSYHIIYYSFPIGVFPCYLHFLIELNYFQL